MPPGGESQPTPLALIVGGDPEALGGYYDAHAGIVNEYCVQLCPAPRAEDAVLAAFTDLLGRVRTAAPDGDLDELLRKSARAAAAARMDLTGMREPVCRFVPELIAARANDEDRRDRAALDKHLATCRFCQVTEQRLQDSERTLLRTSTSAGPAGPRTAWLEIASRAEPIAAASVEEHQEVTSPAAPAAPPPAPAASESSLAPEPPSRPGPVRRRRGGLVGAARRAALSRRR